MNVVTTTALEWTVSFSHDAAFYLLSLHREHGLAIDDRGALVRKPGLRCASDKTLLPFSFQVCVSNDCAVDSCPVFGGLVGRIARVGGMIAEFCAVPTRKNVAELCSLMSRAGWSNLPKNMKPTNSNHELIRKGLELLREGLKPFIEKEMRDVYGSAWEQEGRNALRMPSYAKLNWDAYAILKLIHLRWNEVFRERPEGKHRSWVTEALALRNELAHNTSLFSDGETVRGLDTIERLLAAVSAPNSRGVALLKNAIGEGLSAPHAIGEVREAAARVPIKQARSEIQSQFKHLPINLIPPDPVVFKQQLLQSRVAEIVTTYSDGRVETKIWRAANFSPSSNVIGNLRSRAEFRAGQWQANGITMVTVRVLENV